MQLQFYNLQHLIVNQKKLDKIYQFAQQKGSTASIVKESVFNVVFTETFNAQSKQKVVYQKLLYFIYSKVDLTYFLQNKKYFYAFQIHIPFGILYPRHAIIFHLEDWSKLDEHLESTL